MKVLVMAIMIIFVYGVITIMQNIEIADGYVGDQEVTIVKFFHYLTVHDKEGNERHYKDVTGYSFIEDELILNIEESRDKGETVKISRTAEMFKRNGKITIAILDFSHLTIFDANGGRTYYYGVKEIANDHFDSLKILHYDGSQEWIE